MSSRQPLLGRALTGVAALAVLLAPFAARAIYLDEGQNWSFRLRAYSQAAIRLQNSRSIKTFSSTTGQLEESQTVPETKAGQLVQNRFFFNPELDIQITPYTSWMKEIAWLKWLAPDDFRGRVAGWGFYDGIYDYGSSQFKDSANRINSSFDPAVPAVIDSSGFPGSRIGGWYVEAKDIRKLRRDADGNVTSVFDNFGQIFGGYELKTPRTTYGYARRVNEAYLSYSKGPVFVRLGKQSISWGESDTIALLDQTNPFGVLMGAPGFFQDIDEARIPLWTLRASYNLFSNWGPFSSTFIEGYWVPGDIDTNTGILPISTASPYSAPGADPGRSNPIFPSTFQFVLADNVPKKSFENSRYGFRLQTVVNRFLTLQAWYYRTFPQQPVPLKIGFTPDERNTMGYSGPSVRDQNGNVTDLFIVALQHKLVNVFGAAGTFFFEPLDGIIRMNAQFFHNEPGFIPEQNLQISNSQLINRCNELMAEGKSCGGRTGQGDASRGQGTLPRADIIRAELGFDRFFFVRALNPTNSFVLASSIVGSYNLDETKLQDFRAGGLFKPGVRCGDKIVRSAACENPVPLGADADDYVQSHRFDGQAQITLQSDWLHGKLQPRLTWIQFFRGTYAVHPSVIYRWNDWLLFQADFQWIGGEYQSLGFFRDRGQISGRITYQLN